MKLVSNGLAISLLFSVRAAEIPCDDRKSGVYIDPDSCGRYYTCVDGISKPYVTDCPGDLVFDYTKSACNFAEVTDCSRGDPCIVQEDGHVPSILKCLGVEIAQPKKDPVSEITAVQSDEWDNWCAGQRGIYGIFVHPRKCNQYITCLNATTVDAVAAIGILGQCPTDQVFDHTRAACSLTADARQCSRGQRSDPCVGNGHVATILKCLNIDLDEKIEYPPQVKRSTEWDGFCLERNKPGVYVHPSNCGSYITCTNATFGSELNCPGNDLTFDPSKSGCNFAHLVDCQGGVRADKGGCIAASNGHVGDIKNCLGIKDEIRPEPLMKRVAPAHDPAIVSFCRNKNAGIYTMDGTCKEYVTCVAGKVEGNSGVKLTCPGELVFDHTRSACNFAAAVDCRGGVRSDDKGCTAGCAGNVDCIFKCYNPKLHADQTKPRPQSLKAAPVPLDSRLANFCDKKNAGIYISDLIKCNQFLTCIQGVFDPIVTVCPGNFKFNHEKSSCDFERNVDCGRASYPGCNGEVSCIKEEWEKENPQNKRKRRSPKFF